MAIHEGWMVRFGKRKIGGSFIHMRYFVLESSLLAYYKAKPQDNQIPVKTICIDENCGVVDKGLQLHSGHMVHVLSVYNNKEKSIDITFGSFNMQEALVWKHKIEQIISQGSQPSGGGTNIDMDSVKKASSSNHERVDQEDENSPHSDLLRRIATEKEPLESTFDCNQGIISNFSNQDVNEEFLKQNWRLLRCQNGLRVFEELLDVSLLPKRCCRLTKAVGVVKASCEEIFEQIISFDTTRFEWDCSFQQGRLVEEVDAHTSVLYHRLQFAWFPRLMWPRDLCYVRCWRRNDDGSYVVLFRSREHKKCGPQPGCVRAHIESGGYYISPLKPRNGRSRTQVQHFIQIDLKGWGASYIPSFQQHCLCQILNSVAGLREFFAQSDERNAPPPRIPVMDNMFSTSVISENVKKTNNISVNSTPINKVAPSAPLMKGCNEDEDFETAGLEKNDFLMGIERHVRKTALHEYRSGEIDSSLFFGNLHRDDRGNARNCWNIADGNNFKVRSKHFLYNQSKVVAGKHLMDLVAVDWFKDSKKMNHVAKRHGCAAQVASEMGFFSIVINIQVPASSHYSMVFYFVTRELVPGTLLQRFVDGDDAFRNSRLKLIPSVRKGPWIARQNIGGTHCLMGKAVDCNYIRGPKYLEIDVDLGSSTIAMGFSKLVLSKITSLVVDVAFLVQSNTSDELPERLIGALRISHLELGCAVDPRLDPDPL